MGSGTSLPRSTGTRVVAPPPTTHGRFLLPTVTTPLSQYFSTTAANTTDSTAQPNQKREGENNSNIFLDNLGTIFLTAIGLVIASLVRSFYGSSRKTKLTRALEATAALDPLEMDDLRYANPHITVTVFQSLIETVRTAFPQGQATYKEVVYVVRKALQQQHHIPTIELGHLLDRTALHIAQHVRHTTTDQVQPVTLWLVLLSCAVNAPVPDKIRLLYDVLASENSNSGTAGVTILQVRDLVGYLQDTSQLVLETQIIPTPGAAYPIQAYHRGTPDELVHWQDNERGAASLQDTVDVDALADILRSKSVCAWGECYAARKFV